VFTTHALCFTVLFYSHFHFCKYAAFGPMVLAMLAFLVVHVELEMKMLGSLRALGLRESVYWTSWQIPFMFISLVNALLGALTATLIASEVHVYQHLYFGGMFGSLFFLNISLVSASLFLAACCGTSRHGAPWLVVLMFIGVWIPFCVIAASSTIPYSASSVNTSGLSASPAGLFWINANTVRTRTYPRKDHERNGHFSCSSHNSFFDFSASRLIDSLDAIVSDVCGYWE
jgi:hypothetical protein